QNLLSSRMNMLQDQKVMMKSPLSQKIALLLLNFLDKETDHGNASIKLHMTRKEIADNLGASVESVIRIMSDWSKKGIIQTTDQQIQVLQVEKIIDHLNEFSK
ncbi:MAG: winged helix-turn-helix domain-containing protein, partial [Bdellovibrionales bacterium]|nr:winged helix-turn-helix domain-containing protein [Bdellovibrionales bacterium]